MRNNEQLLTMSFILADLKYFHPINPPTLNVEITINKKMCSFTITAMKYCII